MVLRVVSLQTYLSAHALLSGGKSMDDVTLTQRLENVSSVSSAFVTFSPCLLKFGRPKESVY